MFQSLTRPYFFQGSSPGATFPYFLKSYQTRKVLAHIEEEEEEEEKESGLESNSPSRCSPTQPR